MPTNESYSGVKTFNDGEEYSNCVFQSGCKFEGHMYGVSFTNCTMLQCDFSGACCGSPTFNNCTVQDAKPPSGAHCGHGSTTWSPVFNNTPSF